MVMRIEGRSEIKASRIVILHPRNPRLEDMADFPKLGALIHVLIKPLLPHRQVELLNKKNEVRVKGSQEGQSPLQELDGHEIGGQENTFQIINTPEGKGLNKENEDLLEGEVCIEAVKRIVGSNDGCFLWRRKDDW
nr:hypothetical protein BHM03_00046835 [Ipomoea batatas]